VGRWANRKKKELKICRHFSYDILIRVHDTLEWEPEQLAELVIAISKEMGLTLKDLQRMLEKTNLGSPQLLSVLADAGYEFDIKDILSLFLRTSDNILSYIKLIDDALEIGLLSLHDSAVLNKVSHQTNTKKHHLTSPFIYSYVHFKMISLMIFICVNIF